MNVLKEQDCQKTTLLYYESAASCLDVSEHWKQYIAALAFELFGDDTEDGDAFVKNGELLTGDPLNIIRKMADSDVSEARNCPNHPFGMVKEKNTAALAKRIWKAQVKVCLPLIEIERCAYISTEYGRLLSVLGAEYWDRNTEEYKVLWNHQLDAAVEDPYDLEAVTLYQLGYMIKRLEMLGTVSYTPFFRMYNEDRDRLGFIADLRDRLAHYKLCSVEELEKLFAGHIAFIAR